jgi:hypothetical protein
MNSFVNAAIQQPDSLTENGAATFASSLDTHVDLFFRVGASRGKAAEVVNLFKQALKADSALAIRIALWARDVRGGAGEREIFREMLKVMSTEQQAQLVRKIVEVGRWDDLGVLVEHGDVAVSHAAAWFWRESVLSGNGLAAKWAPRKGNLAVKLRNIWQMSPKQYRKTLVTTTNVVEQKMCAKQWDEIEFGHVPSVAAARYNTAFMRNATEQYKAYKEALVKGDAKINATAIFPHDVIRAAYNLYGLSTPTVDTDVVDAQWNALPDYCNGKASDILVMSDVSGSMSSIVSGTVTAMHVSIALGLYISERQTGAFKDLVLTFDTNPTFHKVHGEGIVARTNNLANADWGGSTDLNKAFKLVLQTAIDNKVSADEMPKILLVLSDMEFNYCGKLTNHQALRQMYAEAGYEMPKVVFWNLNSCTQNVPVRHTEQGVALVSGFSPAILKSILGAEDFSPKQIMLDAVMSDRYTVEGVTA